MAASTAAPAANSGDDIVTLDPFNVTDAKKTDTTLPGRPVTALYGFETAYQDVPRSIAQLGGSGGIALVEELARTAAPRSKEPTAAKFRQIYLDTGAGGRGPEAIALAVRVFGADRIVFGTDYAPQASVAPVIANIVQSPLTAFQRRAVFTDTPRALLASTGVKLPSLA